MSFFRYLVGGVGFYLANLLFMFILVGGMNVHYLVATTISTVILFITRYFLFKEYVFKKQEVKKNEHRT